MAVLDADAIGCGDRLQALLNDGDAFDEGGEFLG